MSSPLPGSSRTIVLVLSYMVAAIAVAIPITAAIRSWPTAVSAQIKTDTPYLAPSDESAYAEFGASIAQTAPVIVSYHDIHPDAAADDPYAITPSSFAQQMAMLDAAGFTTLTSQELDRYLAGGSVPPRSVVLTFDDGTKSLWTYVDPILREYDFNALAFVITSVIGQHQPYYLTPQELGKLQETGRWDIEAHTDSGHVWIPVGPEQEGPFLLNRRWLDNEERLESLEEWGTRVSSDLDTNIEVLVGLGFDRPLFLAYPFSSVIAPTNDERIPGLLNELVLERFSAGMTNHVSAGLIVDRDIAVRHLPRVEVFQDTHTRALFERLVAVELVSVQDPAVLTQHEKWIDGNGNPLPLDWFEGEQLSPISGVGRYSVAFAPGQTRHWSDYEVSVRVSDLGDVGSRSSGELVVLSGSDAEHRISVSNGRLRIYAGTFTGTRLDQSISVARHSRHPDRIHSSG